MTEPSQEPSREHYPENWPQPDETSTQLEASICANHPETAATSVCGVCGSWLCDACVHHRQVGRSQVRFCVSCGGMCHPIESSEDDAPPETEAQAWLGAFTQPFQSEGAGPFLGLTGFFYLLALLGWIPLPGMFLVTLPLGLIALGLLSAYAFSVILAAATGDDRLPQWNDFSDSWNDLVRPLLLLLGAMALAFGPWALAPFFITDVQTLRWVRPLLLLGGSLYFPMSLIAIALLDSIAGLSPAAVAPAIMRAPGKYLLLWSVLAVLGVAASAILVLVTPLPIVGPFLAIPLALYLLTVGAGLMGRFCFLYKKQLGWAG